MSPLELFCGTKFNAPVLQSQHVWGCPVYVLDPTLQDGKKLPKWQPRSWHGIYVGTAPEFASNVGLILNPTTGYISSQFHVVYDDWFTTVYSPEGSPPSNWLDLTSTSTSTLHDDEGQVPLLNDEWLDSKDLAQKQLKIADMKLQREAKRQHLKEEDQEEHPTPPTLHKRLSKHLQAVSNSLHDILTSSSFDMPPLPRGKGKVRVPLPATSDHHSASKRPATAKATKKITFAKQPTFIKPHKISPRKTRSGRTVKPPSNLQMSHDN